MVSSLSATDRARSPPRLAGAHRGRGGWMPVALHRAPPPPPILSSRAHPHCVRPQVRPPRADAFHRSQFFSPLKSAPLLASPCRGHDRLSTVSSFLSPFRFSRTVFRGHRIDFNIWI